MTTTPASPGPGIKLGAFLLFASGVPLAVTAAVLYRRLRALGITAPGSAITLVGGVRSTGPRRQPEDAPSSARTA